MDVDIRKPDTGAVQINRPTSAAISTTTTPSPDPASPRLDGGPPEFGQYTEPLSEGEEDEDFGAAVAADEENRAGLTKGQAEAAIKYRTEMLEQSRKDKQKAGDEGTDSDDERKPFLKSRRASVPNATPAEFRARNLSIDPLAPAAVFDKTLQSRLQKESKRQSAIIEDNEDVLDEDDQYRGEYAPAGQKKGWAAKVKG